MIFKRIEVIKGAQSSIWGADAKKTGSYKYYYKNTSQDGTHGNATIEYGRYNKNGKSKYFTQKWKFWCKIWSYELIDGFQLLKS